MPLFNSATAGVGSSEPSGLHHNQVHYVPYIGRSRINTLENDTNSRACGMYKVKEGQEAQRPTPKLSNCPSLSAPAALETFAILHLRYTHTGANPSRVTMHRTEINDEV
jgi:hypothetical protein